VQFSVRLQQLNTVVMFKNISLYLSNQRMKHITTLRRVKHGYGTRDI